jgi:hypothetical protein
MSTDKMAGPNAARPDVQVSKLCMEHVSFRLGLCQHLSRS